MEQTMSPTNVTKTRIAQNDIDRIFEKRGMKGMLDPNIAIEEGLGNATNLLMYLSRHNSPERSNRRRRKGDRGAGKNYPRRDSNAFNATNLSAPTEESESLFPDAQRFRDKRRQISTSLATLVMKPEKRYKVVEDGAIQALLKLATAPDDVITRCVASAFAYMSTEVQLREVLIEKNVLAALTGIVQAQNGAGVEVITRGNCVKALCNLAMVDGLEAKVVRDGGPSIANLTSNHPELLDYSLTSLLNMSCVSDKYHKIEDVTDSTMHIVEHCSELTESQDIKILSIIANLSNLRSNQLRLVEDGVMSVIEGHISSPSDKTRVLVGHIISNLTTCSRTRIKLVDLGIIRALLTMAKDGVDDVRAAALSAFHNLSRDNACREKVVAAGAVVVVVRISMEPDVPTAICETASKTLKILCRDLSIIDFLVRDGVVKALVTLVRYPSLKVQLACAQAICALLDAPQCIEKLIQLGAVGVLVYLCNHRMSTHVGEWCAFALLLLSYCDETVCSPKVLTEGVLPSVLKLCDKDSSDVSELTHSFCATALAVLTRNANVKTSPSIPILVHMLNEDGSEDIKTDCASALYSLAISNKNCEEMLSAGALLPIIQLTKSDHLDTKIRCAAILSRLTAYPEYHHLMTKNDLKRLLELSTVDFMDTQRRVVITLSNLSENEVVRNMLLEIPETCEAMKLLISRPDDMIRGGCSSILCNLSSAPGFESEIVQAGVVPTLLVTALLTSDKMDCKVVCVKALVNMMQDPTCHDSMVKDGLIWAFSTLAGYQDETLVMLCARSLSNLSRSYAKNFLDSAVAVGVVMDFVVNKKTKILRYGSRILLNMLQTTTEADEEFRREAVERMAIVRDSDEEVSRLTILCLCLASQSESCRAIIVSSGILHSIDAFAIFRDPQLSYAYLTMFGNIAQNPSMRVRLLDRSSVDKFSEMSKTTDTKIHVALAKAMYCVSCSKDNIAFFSQGNSEENILGILQRIFDNADDTVRPEICVNISAFLYNLTIEPDCANAFLSQGIMKVLLAIWPEMVKAHETTRLVVMSVANLACGKVNTARLVEQEGAMELMCFMVGCQEANDKTANYAFSDQDYYTWSAAIRNLSNVIANHEAMASAGCVKHLVTVARDCYARLAPKDSKGNPAPPPPARTVDEMNRIIHNCTAALRSMTYHVGMQEMLSSSGGIDIIILASQKDVDEQNLDINSSLLHEIESESWKNGTRGITKDGRADVIPDMVLCEDYLGAATEVELDFITEVEPLEKMVVSIHVGDNEIDASGNHDRERKTLEGVVDILFDSDKEDGVTEGFALLPKIEVPETELESNIHVILADVELYDTDDEHFCNNITDSAADVRLQDYQISPSPSPEGSPQSAIEAYGRSPINLQVKTNLAQDGSLLPGISSPPPGKSSGLTSSPAPASVNELSHRMPDIRSPQPNGGAQLSPMRSGTGEGFKPASSGKKQKTKGPTRLDKFDKLVSIIALSKRTKGAYIDEVANTWNEVSKY